MPARSANLGQGFDRIVGVKGSQISGGQKQRIAIARTLLRDPKILVMDEATSALDAENEKIILENIAKTGQNNTLIMITHRVNTLRHFDQIFVINKGYIQEKGSYTELQMNSSGYFSSLEKQQHQSDLIKA